MLNGKECFVVDGWTLVVWPWFSQAVAVVVAGRLGVIGGYCFVVRVLIF